MNILTSILSFWPIIPLLGIVIFFHELGHYLAAKWRGVTVLKFSLGMGPEMVGFTRAGTRYCLSWIPLGGYVQMAGDSLEEDGSIPKGGPEQFLTHPWFGRLIIAIAGPFANLVTAWLVAFVTLAAVGVSQPDFPNLIGAVEDDSPAAVAGVRAGDRFTSVDATPVATWHELVNVLIADTSRTMTITMERAGETYPVVLGPGQHRPWLRGLEPEGLLPVAGMVSPGMPAYRAGVKEGDRFVAIEGVPVNGFHEIKDRLKGRADSTVRFTLEREGKRFDLTITPMRADPNNPDSPDGQIGIMAPRALVYRERFSLDRAFLASFPTLFAMVDQVYRNLWLTVSRPFYYREAVGGPIFIGQMARESARQGLDSFLWLLAMINLAIMSFNLLPIPLLDGGHIVLALLEGVRRRAMTGRSYLTFQKVGLAIVGTLFVFILSQDLLRPILRARAVEKATQGTSTVAPETR